MPDEESEYNPFEHREVQKPTTDLDTLAHLLKGSLGSGILAMPFAIKHAGIYFGLVATFVVGFILTYSVHILVKNAHRLCFRLKIPQLAFDEVAETAFLAGPEVIHKFSKVARTSINLFLIVDLYGCCCVYIVFCAKNLKQVIDYYTEYHYTDRMYMLMLLPFLLAYITIRTLKILAPLSMSANLLVTAGLIITLFYAFSGIPSPNDRVAVASYKEWPLFFGIVIFSLEGIGVVLPLENNMMNPAHFIGCPSVLVIGMVIVVSLYTIIGFFGYLKYGSDIQGSITLNLPQDEILSQSVKVMFAVAMFQTYGLQFYVPFQIMWRTFKDRFGKWNLLVEYALRFTIVSVTVIIAIAVPNLGAVMSLVGAVCLSFLGLIFPATIDLVTCWETPGLGPYKWRLIVDTFLIVFGLLGFFFGTYVSILEIIKVYTED